MTFEIIRDPLWNNIRLDPLALSLVDTPAFQRLRYVRQLGLAYLVYPGASHSRFEHALGAYHLSRRVLALLEERGLMTALDSDACVVTRTAALLHDIGHYPFSHALTRRLRGHSSPPGPWQPCSRASSAPTYRPASWRSSAGRATVRCRG